jgi:hypothetical protein
MLKSIYQNPWWTLVGFVSLILGFLSLVLSLIGMRFMFLSWIDAPGPLVGFVIKLFMIFLGIALIVMSRVNFEEE